MTHELFTQPSNLMILYDDNAAISRKKDGVRMLLFLLFQVNLSILLLKHFTNLKRF